MTLVILAGRHEGVWLSSDHRLSAFPTGKVITDASVKQNLLICPDGVLVIGYAGLGRDKSGSDISDWLRGCLRGLNLRVDDALEVVKERATAELRATMPHYFLAGAFIKGLPALYHIANHLTKQLAHMLPRNYAERFARLPRHQFFKVHFPVANSGLMLAGSGQIPIYRNEKDRMLLHRLTAMSNKRPEDYAGLLARLNESAAKRTDTVSPACVVTYIAPSGQHRVFRYSGSYSKPDEALQIPVNLYGIDLKEAMAFVNAQMPKTREELRAFLSSGAYFEKMNEAFLDVGQSPRKKPSAK